LDVDLILKSLGLLRLGHMHWRVFACFSLATELIQIQFHQVFNKIGHFLFVILQLLAVNDVLVF